MGMESLSQPLIHGLDPLLLLHEDHLVENKEKGISPSLILREVSLVNAEKIQPLTINLRS